ncbi:GIY-YIG nuclease family protein [Candidatus Falkowbacteria bacterium]|nr:GIY-YIG nuclease family protein [Candidatus Falkowbacteria bacterium]
MFKQIGNFQFVKVCDIKPVDKNGLILENYPQTRYKNVKNLPLHKHGKGPFCKFKISLEYNRKAGVYALVCDDVVKYIGECNDLGRRWNAGYGQISPRNPHRDGQQTNCRINNLILNKVKNGKIIELFFYKTNKLDIENDLIFKLNPEWNKTTGRQNIAARSNKRERGRAQESKYYELGEYLRNSNKQIEVLSYNEIEKILGSELPASARKHRPWWGNDHNLNRSQEKSWLNAGWEVAAVSMGHDVTFRKNNP